MEPQNTPPPFARSHINRSDCSPIVSSFDVDLKTTIQAALDVFAKKKELQIIIGEVDGRWRFSKVEAESNTITSYTLLNPSGFLNALAQKITFQTEQLPSTGEPMAYRIYPKA